MVKKFIRKDANKKKRIAKTGWRKPKGITNKMRLSRKGHLPTVKPGYCSPTQEKNKADGLHIIKVSNLAELEKINPKTQAVVIGKAGKQKKLDMIKKAEELKIKIINLKIDKFKDSTENFFNQRQKVSKEKIEEKKKKEAELKEAEKKKAEEEAKKEKEEPELSDEEKKKQEKKEKDKILTQKGGEV